MELDREIGVAQAEHDAKLPLAFEELAAENARLRRLVGELLLKNQHLRETITMEYGSFETRQKKD
jgi:hypothetical protein